MSQGETGDTLALKRAEHAALLRESLRRIVESLSVLEGVERVSLFGSYARGRADLLTDLDVLVVMRTDLGFVDRLRWLYERLAVPVDLDLLCYTPEEFDAMRDRSFLRRIRQDEVLLYEKPRA
jgi:predicted nucleotidyltransferase